MQSRCTITNNKCFLRFSIWFPKLRDNATGKFRSPALNISPMHAREVIQQSKYYKSHKYYFHFSKSSALFEVVGFPRRHANLQCDAATNQDDRKCGLVRVIQLPISDP